MLPYQDIRDRIEKDGLIENADLEACIGPSSYELRIGSALNVGDDRRYDIGVGEEFALKPQSHLLIGSIEKIKMPKDLAGTMFLKSKFGRSGFIPWGQGLIDPGYSGNLTISIINMSPYPRIFSGGEKICHVIFQKLTRATDRPYDGEYNGANGAKGPKEKPMLVLGSPIRDLLNAGVSGLVGGLAQGAVGG